MNKFLSLPIIAVLLLTGCATGTRNIELNLPEYSGDKSKSGAIYIDTLEDKRIFEQKPRNPSTPSVDGDLSTTTKDELASLIGRQRNGYGQALGDVALPSGVTVRGYTVVDNADAPIKLAVDIEKFWAWFSPGLFTVSFESTLQCKLDFEQTGETTSFTVSGYGINKGQVASDANWELAYQRGFQDFLDNLEAALDNAGL